MEHLGQFVLNHWQLCLAFVIILVLLFINEAMTQKRRGQELSPQAAVNLINHEDALILDLRDKEQFLSGHIIDSIQANADDPMDKYKDKTLLLTCARGIQSAALAEKLRNQSFQKLFVLHGGIEAWKQAGLPLVKGKSKPALRAV